MKNIHAMAGGSVGYVCGVLSSRQRGVAFPLDLVRSVARVAARLAVRRRVAREFGGYLVTDGGGAEMPFSSGRRRVYVPSFYRAGWGPRRDELQHWAWDAGAADGYSIDSADWIAAGGMYFGGMFGMSLSVVRGRS